MQQIVVGGMARVYSLTAADLAAPSTAGIGARTQLDCCAVLSACCLALQAPILRE